MCRRIETAWEEVLILLIDLGMKGGIKSVSVACERIKEFELLAMFPPPYGSIAGS